MKLKSHILALILALCASLTPLALAVTSDGKLDRTSLPIPEPDYPRSTVLDARDAKAPPRFEIKAPVGVAVKAEADAAKKESDVKKALSN